MADLAACLASSRGCPQRACRAAGPVSNLDRPHRFPAPQVDWVCPRDRVRRRLALRADWVSTRDRVRRRLALRAGWASTRDRVRRRLALRAGWASIRDRVRRCLIPRAAWVSIHDRARRHLFPWVDWVSTPASDPTALPGGPRDPAVDATTSPPHAVGDAPWTMAWLPVWLAARSVAAAALPVPASPAAARRDRQVWSFRRRANDRL
jgi:hypothetical protein